MQNNRIAFIQKERLNLNNVTPASGFRIRILLCS